MAAMPLDTAVQVPLPLADLSPLLLDDWTGDSLRASSNIADEARKLFSSLATAGSEGPAADNTVQKPSGGSCVMIMCHRFE